MIYKYDTEKYFIELRDYFHSPLTWIVIVYGIDVEKYFERLFP